MTAAVCRRIALSCDGATEGSHMGAVDLRISQECRHPIAQKQASPDRGRALRPSVHDPALKIDIQHTVSER
jgi:hypothetical protein